MSRYDSIIVLMENLMRDNRLSIPSRQKKLEDIISLAESHIDMLQYQSAADSTVPLFDEDKR